MPRARKSSAVIAAAAVAVEHEKKKKKGQAEYGDVPEETDEELPAWIEKVTHEVRAMLKENLPQIKACAMTQPDSKVKVALGLTLDMLEMEGSVHVVKMRYAPRPFVDERVVGEARHENTEEADEE